MIKRAKKRVAREATGLWVKAMGMLGLVVIVGLVAVFAASPFIRSAPSTDRSGQHHREMLAGREYDTTVQVRQDGSFEVTLAALEPGNVLEPLPSAHLSMRGGGMASAPEVVQEKPGVFAIRGVLPMRGDFELMLTASGQSVIVTLPNTWSF